MYKSDLIPEDFDHIAEVSDNYVVWVKSSNLVNATDYQAYYQFFKPSFYVLPVSNYRIKTGTSYSYESGDISYSMTTLSPDSDYITNNNWENADFPDYFVCQFIVVIMFLWVFKQLSRCFFKGGLC